MGREEGREGGREEGREGGREGGRKEYPFISGCNKNLNDLLQGYTTRIPEYLICSLNLFLGAIC